MSEIGIGAALGWGKGRTSRRLNNELSNVPGDLYMAYCTKRIEFLDVLKARIQSNELKPEDFLAFIDMLKEDIQEREEIYKVLHDSMQIMSETARSFERKVKEHNQVGFNWSEHDWLGK